MKISSTNPTGPRTANLHESPYQPGCPVSTESPAEGDSPYAARWDSWMFRSVAEDSLEGHELEVLVPRVVESVLRHEHAAREPLPERRRRHVDSVGLGDSVDAAAVDHLEALHVR